MKALFTAVVAAMLIAAPVAQAGESAVTAPIRKLVAAFNGGDVAAIKAVQVDAPSIIDNTPPFAWSGPGAIDHWLADHAKAEAEMGQTDGVVWLGEPMDEKVAGDRAYVVMPSRYTYKLKGQSLRETGLAAFALVKQGADWKIASWAWASPKGAPIP